MKDINSRPPFILVFDIDGVLADPQLKKVTNLEILEEIVKRLEIGIPVAFNTGRSLSWVVERIIKLLKSIDSVAKYPEILGRIFISSEKGAVWASFDSDGKIRQNQDKTITVPEGLIKKVRALIEEEYPDCVSFDESKLSMITAEMKTNFPFKEFQKIQGSLYSDMCNLAAGFGNKLRVIATTIDVEIEDKRVGKNLGAVRILDWLKEKDIKPKEFITIGDSESDLLMAEEFSRQGYKTKFVFVGEKLGDEKYDFLVEKTRKKYTEGTLEFLESL